MAVLAEAAPEVAGRVAVGLVAEAMEAAALGVAGVWVVVEMGLG